jgi:phage terminase large subunit-like protein
VPKSKTNYQISVQYAKDILSGKIVAGEYVGLACDRYLGDLKRKDLTMDEKALNRFVNFVKGLQHVKGRWAQRKELFVPQPWQIFKAANLFGLHKDGVRKYIEAYCEIPRKNGKSFDAASIGLYMLLADNEFGAEVYCGATKESQAMEVFRPARLMVERDEELMDAYGLPPPNTMSIMVPEDGAFFQPVVGEPGDGASPHCGIVDEYHEHKNNRLYDTFKTGLGAREKPLLYVVTTAGDDVGGPCFERREEVIEILKGVYADEYTDSVFGLLYTIDEGIDWKSEEALRMANPNLDISVDFKYLKRQQLQAIRNTAKQGIFKTKHLNQWINANETFINYEEWAKCADPEMDINDYTHMPMMMGVDLASRIDFTSSVKCFYEDNEQGKRHYYLFANFWVPEERVKETERYQPWAREYNPCTQDYYENYDGESEEVPFLMMTDGDEVDTVMVKKKLVHDIETYFPEEVSFDPWKSAGYEQDLEDAGAEITKFNQTIGYYTSPMNEFEAAVKSGRLHHTDHPILNWNIMNLQSKRDTNGNAKPRKEDVRKKIDGACAAIMAVGRAMQTPDEGLQEDLGSI